MIHIQVREQINVMLIIYSTKSHITSVLSFHYIGLERTSKVFLLRGSCFQKQSHMSAC